MQLRESPTGLPVFYRTYSRRKSDGSRESWEETQERAIIGLIELGQFTDKETGLVAGAMQNMTALPSGRWLWVGGTDWIKNPENFSGAYNCTSVFIDSWHAMALLMDLAMMGSGTGAMLEDKNLALLPTITNKLNVINVIPPAGTRQYETTITTHTEDEWLITVGDSRKGWVKAYETFLELSTDAYGDKRVTIDMRSVRLKGSELNGFGGVANPEKLVYLWNKLEVILNGAVGRKLTALEATLVIDEAALVVVAGNIRRSAGMRQFSFSNELLKTNLWQQDEHGNWYIDPKRDALRMANHTRVLHTKPTRAEVRRSIEHQFRDGEGALMYAPEAEWRAQGKGRYGLNPCGEIIGNDFHCNLAEVHLNNLDPNDAEAQRRAFQAVSLIVAAQLHHRFVEPRFQESREQDPIVGVSFTGLFDFFVSYFGVEWLQWWKAGRPTEWEYVPDPKTAYDKYDGNAYKSTYFLVTERKFFKFWKGIVKDTIREYCDKHDLKMPNRVTTVQPAGTKSLLTNASPGWHPPKAIRYIRRITFGVNDPVALAAIDAGYNVMPGQNDKSEYGKLLEDPFDPRVTEWLVEIPVQVPWADVADEAGVDPNLFSAAAQLDFYMQVQGYYTEHNTSGTIELREDEIEEVAEFIYDEIFFDGDYISVTFLSRTDAPFPRMPFEPITLEQYERAVEAVEFVKTLDFEDGMVYHDLRNEWSEQGPAGCDSDKCLISTDKL